MKTILLIISIVIFVIFVVFPILLCYLVTGKIKLRDISKIYTVLFRS